ncbi:MAG: cbb3-type cytochrome c oxidase subunit 3 [Bdellovibrionales bacterium]|nr:cbb3-type cytochrome c oxidase subunit 3 [Bdellovibrionales bacterium]
MKQEALSAFQYGSISSIAMILFMVVFVGFIYFAYSQRNKEFFEEMSQLPLNEEKKYEPR